ncbi:MAG: glutamate--tRNA ligase, partial [Thermoguttaceae bacterium]|nr:glutamate--tRNA ligase [Thermoguttaceae bacterium]
MTSEVRTRFAPSPTGYLHIGGVRTALFCYLFAKKNGGKFILRIDDTDQTRNVEEALQPILDGLKWLGIEWDEGPGVGGPYGPYYQSQRSDKYQAAVDKLLEGGFAYRDYARPEELQKEREEAVAAKRTFVYSRRWAAHSEEECRKFEAEGRSGVVRLKMPREGKLVIHDLIRGDVEFDWATEQDHVIQRADGSFIYHLANVVDDDDIRISHVIRAEEHLSNTPRQIFIAQSLGIPLPQYAHLPFVAEPGSKTKLSKRKLDKYLKNNDFAKLVRQGTGIADRVGLATTADGFNPVIVDFYRQTGYLPEAILNYLALLGWALDDKTEYFMPSELVSLFSFEGVTKSAASFDPAKLFAFQEKHMNNLSSDEKYARVIRYLVAAGWLKILDGPYAGKTSFEELPDLLPAGTTLALSRHPEMTPEQAAALLKGVIAGTGDRIKVS